MLVACVIDHQVKNKLHVVLMTGCNQVFHVFNCSVRPVHRFIVRDIITHVDLRRLEHRRQPYHVYSQRRNVFDLLQYTRYVTPAVAVAVFEASRIYLVECGFFPPDSLVVERVSMRRHDMPLSPSGELYSKVKMIQS
jgi:hypothetical protein